MTPGTRQHIATEAAAFADRLRADLARLTGMLDGFRGASGLEFMRDRSLRTQARLEAISSRIGALGSFAAPGAYALCESEHDGLAAASDLRDRLMESLARYQRSASRTPIPLAFA